MGKKRPALLLAAGISTAAVFAADALTPIGIAAWIFYLVPLGLMLEQSRPRMPLLSAAVSSVLIGIGFVLSPVSEARIVVISEVNRVFGMVTLWTVAVMVRRFILTSLLLREQEWIRSGHNELANRMQGEQGVERLADNVLRFLCGYLESPIGVLYVAGPGGELRRRASYAVPASAAVPEVLRAGDTLVGQALKERRILRLENLPADYLPVSSTLGRTRAAHLLVLPAQIDGEVKAVVELGFLRPIGAPDVDLLEATAARIAIAFRSAEYRARQAALLVESQQQAEELQVQQEELRAINEEMEEQSQTLAESQSRLEAQQAELEQTNAQLEEQAHVLEQQRDDLSRAQLEQLEKAEALARANRYKSEFLANMSHELRTPLNSALILAKLLADNPDGNLTSEQVKYASAIHASGTDLLALLSDILDLSRIEAGHVDIRPEAVTLTTIVGGLKKTFEPMARQKRLALAIETAPDVPPSIKSDPLRLLQILRNLLANAVKFTETGEVALRIATAPDSRVAFSVRDTGLGIPADQHELIFEAFRQVDGSTDRKYGGSGLGLTISRELAYRLGGTLAVVSEVGKGSTFTLTLPSDIDKVFACTPPPGQRPGATLANPVATSMGRDDSSRQSGPRVEDDRGKVAPGERVILVIEDDPAFAGILRDLVRERRFRCLVAATGREGMELAERCPPSAVLLDVHLPDQSGLGLLERLKASPATRHIPVHVLSVDDYAQQALELGAIGYVLKPAERDQLVGAIERLERKLVEPMRRILVAEGAEARRASVRALLEHDGVEIVVVGRGGDALAQLRSTAFDCVVLDLSLPDMSVYDVLDRMAADEACSYPPVVVDISGPLTREEEQRLRRHASSVVIKGARTPERLLDEVSLFLHQIETSLPAEQQRMLRVARQRDAGFEGRNILVVEDDARNIFALSSVLEPRGAKLRVARNGQEAVDALARAEQDPSQGIDLVLMDVMMPVMDGLTATREIRRRRGWANLPIIGLTAKAMADDQRACIDAGMSDYVPKPLDVDRLVSLMKVWLPK